MKSAMQLNCDDQKRRLKEGTARKKSVLLGNHEEKKEIWEEANKWVGKDSRAQLHNRWLHS